MGPDETPHTVVGVVGDVRLDGALAPAVPLAYVPLFQRTTETIFDNLGLTIGLRRRGASGERAHPVPRAVRALDAEMPIEPPEAIDSLIRDSLPLESMLQHLSLIAVTLTLITLSLGLYATASQLAAERAREFGVRLALGARPADLALTVLRWCAVTLGAGLIIGLLIVRALAVPFARAQQLSLTVDALVVGTVSRVVLAVGLAAVGAPAWRALRTDPVASLRLPTEAS
jgi:hypothetical protein